MGGGAVFRATAAETEPDAHALTGTWPLVGREAERQALEDALLRGRSSRSVLLVGAAGVGKTRLAREAERVAQRAGMHSVWVTASSSTARTPFGALAALLPTIDPRRVRSRHSFGDLLRACAQSLLDRAGERRLALFVDDGHLLDDASAALVQQLAGSAIATVIVTLRSGESVPGPLTALWKDDLAERISLAALDVDAAGRLLATTLGGQVDPSVALALQARSGGNVLFLRELVLGALADGSLCNEGGIWQFVRPLRPSERLTELVETRLRNVDERLRAVLELVSLGEPLGSADLDRDDREAATQLEALGLVVSTLDGRRLQLRMTHPLYGEVVRSRTSGLRARATAQTLAERTESYGARRREDVLRVGVWRLDGGGGSADRLLAAAAAARWSYDFALAERLASAAAGAGAGLEGLILAAEMWALNGDPEEGERRLAALQDCVNEDKDRVRLAVARLECLWFFLGRVKESSAIAEAMEATIEDPALRHELRAQKIGLLLSSQGPRAIVADLEPLLAQPGGEASWLSVVASFSFGRMGRIERALEVADRGYRAAARRHNGRSWYPWFDLYVRCEALALAGRFAEADSLAREQYRRGLADGSAEARAWFRWHQARTVHDRGHIDEAIEQAREGLALVRQLALHGHEHDLLAALALSHALAGDPTAAQAALSASDALGVEPRGWTGADLLIARGWATAAAGSLTDARGVLREAAEHGLEVGDLTGAAAALHGVARLGSPAEAISDLRKLAAQIDGILVATRLCHTQALANEDPDELGDVSAAFAAMGAHLLAAEAAADRAVVLARASSGETTAAQHHAALLTEHCAAARTPALRSIDARAGLSDGERETALLAAAGLSDADIAERLHISIRTVGNRLHRTYTKLGIPGRSELPTLLR
jgi:ATP/maltotriose-dependent transcriptional regulator MalT